MTIASAAALKRPLAARPIHTRYTVQENGIHARFAARAAKQNGWNDTKSQFDAMCAECEQFGLKACSFREFCGFINSVRGAYPNKRQPAFHRPEPADWPAKSRPTDLNALLSSLDSYLTFGW